MKLSCKILCTISCVSFSLCAMEEEKLSLCKLEPCQSSTTSTLTSIKYNQKNYNLLNAIYKKTYDTLQNYTPNNNQSIRNIFHTIAAIEDLCNKEINEKEAGHFAYMQMLHKPSSATMPHNSPLYVSIILERIVQHNAHMKKNEFIAPTEEQFIQYMENIRDEEACAELVKCKLILYPKTPQINDLTENKRYGFTELKSLIYDIYNLQQQSPDVIKRGADITYGIPKL